MVKELSKEQQDKLDALQTEPAVYTKWQVMRLLGVGENQLYKNCRKGLIPCRIVGRRFIFPKEALNLWLNTTPVKVR